ncbi:MAG: hypothetical protein ACMXYC_04965 [Candidatus Woesearchaeota archaeon]
MTWKTTTQTADLLMYEKQTKSFNTRLEARLDHETWLVFRTFYNQKGLNLTEHFEAQTREHAQQLIDGLMQEKQPTLSSLMQKMINRAKRAEVKIKRSYKEYNVEKWFFHINTDAPHNMVVLRFHDEIEIDFVIYEAYKQHEKKIVDAILQVLGIDDSDEDLRITCYYFNKTTTQKMQTPENKLMIGKLEFFKE